MLAALVDILKRLAENAPVLLLLEDAHWIDPTTRDLLTRLIDAVASAPVMIVVTARPGVRLAVAGARARRRARARAARRTRSAQRSSPTSSRTAVLPRDVVDDIVASADGVPLFAEELGKSVSEAMQDSLSRAVDAARLADGAPRPPRRRQGYRRRWRR